MGGWHGFGTSVAPSRVDDIAPKPLDKRIGGTEKSVVEGLRQLPEVVLVGRHLQVAMQSHITNVSGCIHNDPQTPALERMHPPHICVRQVAPSGTRIVVSHPSNCVRCIWSHPSINCPRHDSATRAVSSAYMRGRARGKTIEPVDGMYYLISYTIVELSKSPLEIRLVGGSVPTEGRIEVRHHDVWGTVCDDDFTETAASVICRSLKFGGPAEARKNGAFGSGVGQIWLDQLLCVGNESSLGECLHSDWGQHNCRHDEDAAVVCSAGDVVQPLDQPLSVVPVVQSSLSVTSNILPADCGARYMDQFDVDDRKQRVIGGGEVIQGSYPWQASVRVRTTIKSVHWCGAVVISPLHVLTAGHCLQDYTKEAYFVRVGDYDAEADDGTEQELNIDEIYFHEEFNRGVRLNNDIALIKLKSQGIRLGADIQPICLPPSNLLYSPGLNCTISGWGSVKSAGSGVEMKGTGPTPAIAADPGRIWCLARNLGSSWTKVIAVVCLGVVLKQDTEGTGVPAYSAGGRCRAFPEGRDFPDSGGLGCREACLPRKGISAFRSGAGIENSKVGRGLELTPRQDRYSRTLRAIWIPVLPVDTCKANFVYGEKAIGQGMFCAGHLEGGMDSCQGDSGGPMACLYEGHFTLFGITSWGHGCGRPNKPGVYSNVSFYRDWIDLKLRDSMSGR
uniref:Neurotrypsin n=1 Tax=Timema bartmani TaxID=61472 RepID=A0A7R9I1C0_9NEOP|nr:unnamed protein product [Timema bartmani]